MAPPVPPLPTYDQLLLQALQPRNVAPLTTGDLFRAQNVVRSAHGGFRGDDPFFLLAGTAYPVRNVELVGFVAAVDYHAADRGWGAGKAGGEEGIKVSLLLDDGDGHNTISVHQMLTAKRVEKTKPARIEQTSKMEPAPMKRERSASPLRPGPTRGGVKIEIGADGLVKSTSGGPVLASMPTRSSTTAMASLSTMSTAWPASKPGESSASGAKRYITRAQREAQAAAQAEPAPADRTRRDKQAEEADPYADYRYRGPQPQADGISASDGALQAIGPKNKNFKGKGKADPSDADAIGSNGYPAVPTQAPSAAYAHDRRYITKAQRQVTDAQSAASRKGPPEADVAVEYDWPEYAVGSIVRVRGRLKEWRRRTGLAVREIEVVPADAGAIVLATPADEHLHLAAVAAAWRDLYTQPIDLAAQSTNPMTPTKRRLVDTTIGDIRSSPTCSIVSQASQMSIQDSPAKLRHPSKLRSAQITQDRLSTYISAHISEVANQSWADPAVAELGSDIGWHQLQQYMPELSRPSRLSQEKENVPPESDGTPRAIKREPLSQLDRYRPTQGAPSAGQLQPISLAVLQRVPHLRLFARRLYHIESKRRNKAKRQREAGEDGAMIHRHRAEMDAAQEKATRRRALTRLFSSIILDLVARGWLVEVELMPRDMVSTQRVQSSTSFGDWTGDSLADSTLSSTAISAMNASMASAGTSFDDGQSSSDEELPAKHATVGYLPVLPPILGRAIMHVLAREQEARAKRFIPAKDLRRSNGLDTSVITSRLKSLHLRWERMDEDNIIDGLDALLEQGVVKRWGSGWWLASML